VRPWGIEQNAEVLQYLTAPNLVLNSCEHMTRSRFISGDWQAIAVRVMRSALIE